MKKVILAIIAAVFVLTDVGAVTRIQCRIDTARRVVVIPAVEGGADVAVAVIDRSIGVPDTTVTIASQLLMQNDLHGHVEDAAWYLRAPRREAGPAADALMLTQGMDTLRHAGGNSRRNQRLTPLPAGNRSPARRHNPLEMARKASGRSHGQRARTAHGRRRIGHDRLPRTIPHHRNRMARLYILCNQRHELKGKTRREYSPRLRFIPNYRYSPRIAVNSRIFRRS